MARQSYPISCMCIYSELHLHFHTIKRNQRKEAYPVLKYRVPHGSHRVTSS